jgi:anti-sigma B factor antagonist
MNYTVNEEYYCAVIELKGKIMGGPDAKKFRETLKELIDDGKTNVVLDLSQVKFMNSSGLGIIIGGLTTMRNAGGDLRICSAMERIESMLMVSQLNRVFELYPTLEEAIESFQEEEED